MTLQIDRKYIDQLLSIQNSKDSFQLVFDDYYVMGVLMAANIADLDLQTLTSEFKIEGSLRKHQLFGQGDRFSFYIKMMRKYLPSLKISILLDTNISDNTEPKQQIQQFLEEYLDIFDSSRSQLLDIEGFFFGMYMGYAATTIEKISKDFISQTIKHHRNYKLSPSNRCILLRSQLNVGLCSLKVKKSEHQSSKILYTGASPKQTISFEFSPAPPKSRQSTGQTKQPTQSSNSVEEIRHEIQDAIALLNKPNEEKNTQPNSAGSYQSINKSPSRVVQPLTKNQTSRDSSKLLTQQEYSNEIERLKNKYLRGQVEEKKVVEELPKRMVLVSRQQVQETILEDKQDLDRLQKEQEEKRRIEQDLKFKEMLRARQEEEENKMKLRYEQEKMAKQRRDDEIQKCKDEERMRARQEEEENKMKLRYEQEKMAKQRRDEEMKKRQDEEMKRARKEEEEKMKFQKELDEQAKQRTNEDMKKRKEHEIRKAKLESEERMRFEREKKEQEQRQKERLSAEMKEHKENEMRRVEQEKEEKMKPLMEKERLAKQRIDQEMRIRQQVEIRRAKKEEEEIKQELERMAKQKAEEDMKQRQIELEMKKLDEELERIDQLVEKLVEEEAEMSEKLAGIYGQRTKLSEIQKYDHQKNKRIIHDELDQIKQKIKEEFQNMQKDFEFNQRNKQLSQQEIEEFQEKNAERQKKAKETFKDRMKKLESYQEMEEQERSKQKEEEAQLIEQLENKLAIIRKRLQDARKEQEYTVEKANKIRNMMASSSIQPTVNKLVGLKKIETNIEDSRGRGSTAKPAQINQYSSINRVSSYQYSSPVQRYVSSISSAQQKELEKLAHELCEKSLKQLLQDRNLSSKSNQKIQDSIDGLKSFLLSENNTQDQNKITEKVKKAKETFEDIVKEIDYLEAIDKVQPSQKYDGIHKGYSQTIEKILAKHQQPKPKNPVGTCDICFDSYYVEDKYQLKGSCGHTFHKECLQQFIMTQMSERKFPIICPNSECKKEIQDKEVHQILGDEKFKKYQDIQLKMFMEKNIQNIFACPQPNCNYFIWKDNIERAFYCPSCFISICQKCSSEWHPDMTCAEAKKNTDKKLEEQFNSYVSTNKCQKCPTCQRWVLRTEGCDKMTCRCGANFCYACGALNYDCDHHRQDDDYDDYY